MTAQVLTMTSCLQPPLSPHKPQSPRSPQSPSRRANSTPLQAEVRLHLPPACIAGLLVKRKACRAAQALIGRVTVSLSAATGLLQARADTVPQFYFPGGKPVPAEMRSSALEKIDELFRSNPDGLAIPAARELVKEASSKAHWPSSPAHAAACHLSVTLMWASHAASSHSAAVQLLCQRT